MQTETQTADKSVQRAPKAPDDGKNYWFDGDKWIPVDEMEDAHLRRAKLYAQKKAEYFWHKSGEFQDKVEMLEAEAARRGITLKDFRSKFAKNTWTKKRKEANDF